MNARRLSIVDFVLTAVVFIAVQYALYLIFMVVPNERVMGPVQRIFYFHVGSAIACYCSAAVVLAGSVWYLAQGSRLADVIAEAAAEVGFVFCTIVLISGMIWGRSAWNTWFHWEPRLVSFLLMWLIFLAFNLLRIFGDTQKIASHSAVLGIVGALSVPLVIYSIKLLPHLAQLHPEVIERRGLRDKSFVHAWAVTTLALVLFQFALIYWRTRLGKLKHSLLIGENSHE